MSRRISVTVDAEVWLDDIETADLAAELASRGNLADAVKSAGIAAVPPLSGEVRHPLHEIYHAFKVGMADRAAELTRAYICDELGVVL